MIVIECKFAGIVGGVGIVEEDKDDEEEGTAHSLANGTNNSFL